MIRVIPVESFKEISEVYFHQSTSVSIMLVAVQLEPAPMVPAHVCIPDVSEVIVAPDTPPLPVTVVPREGSEPTTPELTVVADWTASPWVSDSTAEKALPAFVTEKSVSINAGTPAVTEPMFSPPIAPLVVVPEIVLLGVTLDPETE